VSQFGRWAARVFRPGGTAPVVTWTIAAITVVVWAIQLLTPYPASPIWPDRGSDLLGYFPPLTLLEPWTLVTSAFVHSPSSIWHIAFNMYALLIVGPILEYAVGRGRFIVLYLLSAFGGSVAVLLLAPGTPVLGASGAIFGLFAAYFVVQRGLGQNPTQILIVVVLNLVIGFLLPGVAWQAHLGGLLIGGLAAFVLVRTRRRQQRGRQIALLLGVFAGACVLVVVGMTIMPPGYRALAGLL
jgi:membrane associated rhomboid family serine protease